MSCLNMRVKRLLEDGRDVGVAEIEVKAMFVALLERVLDDGSITSEEAVLESIRTLGYTAKNVTRVWGTWEAFTTDVVEEAAHNGLLQRDGDTWVLGPKFAANVPISLLHGRRITVLGKAERNRREADRKRPQAAPEPGLMREARRTHKRKR